MWSAVLFTLPPRAKRVVGRVGATQVAFMRLAH
jgi:hypothetical protein